MNMRFFLASRINNPESLAKLENFLGAKFATKTVAYIPTASNGEKAYGDWKDSDALAMARKNFKSVHIVELEDCWERNLLPEFDNVDIIWFAGGYSGYLLYWIRRAKLDKALPDLLKKGAIYLGSSAGSMACSKTQYSAELFDDAETGASLIPGLGYLDFEIRPHYTDDMFESTKKKWGKIDKGELCLLKDGEVITIDDGMVEILGEKRFIRN